MARRTEQVQIIQDVTIMAMASLAETRDNATGNHIRRTQHYVRALATKLNSMPRYASEFDEQTIASLYKSAPLHDIGKVGIPGRHPAQARQADAGGIRDHEDATPCSGATRSWRPRR